MDPEIRKTEEKLECLSSDQETLRLYEAREHALIELNSLLAEGRAEGRAEGKAEGKAEGEAEVALNMLREGITRDVILKVTGISDKELNRLIQMES